MNLRHSLETQNTPFLTRKKMEVRHLLWQNWEVFKLGRTLLVKHDIKESIKQKAGWFSIHQKEERQAQVEHML